MGDCNNPLEFKKAVWYLPRGACFVLSYAPSKNQTFFSSTVYSLPGFMVLGSGESPIKMLIHQGEQH